MLAIGGRWNIRHLKIGNNIKIGGGSGVIKNFRTIVVMGYPAKDLKKFIKENK